ncbi:MAG TPA: hypothetical protein VGM44_12915 [Polyangiaceae bacterium]|jgi:hypothetical protein
MNARDRFVLGCVLVGATAFACSSEDRSSDDSAGASGVPTAGTSSQNGGSSSTSGGSIATSGSGGSTSPSAGTSSTGGTSSIAGSSSTAGQSAGGATAGGSGGAGTTSVAGAAGADTGSAGEGGAPNPPPPPPLLQNGSFELGTLQFWTATVTPSDVGRALFTQWGPNSASPRSIDGDFEAGFWNNTASFKGDLHQTVTGLTPGKYELKLYAAFGLGLNAAYIYAINCGPQDVTSDLAIADGAADFIAVSLPSIDVTSDSCTVGIYADLNVGNWLNVDEFVFDQVPSPPPP